MYHFNMYIFNMYSIFYGQVSDIINKIDDDSGYLDFKVEGISWMSSNL